MMLDVRLGGFARMVHGMLVMAASGMGMMSRCFVIAGFMVPGGFAMMLRRMLVMFGCFVMMLGCVLRHVDLLRLRPAPRIAMLGVGC
jgi:hypothetical protein